MRAAIETFRTSPNNDKAARKQARQRLIDLANAEGIAVLTARATTDQPFVERLVAFWSNHLCVSGAAKRIVAPLAGHYEREAIRPHVLGRFEDLLLASARHPAMLGYLDNAASIGPNSPAGRASARRDKARGLNENYARELLELHTLGVDGGYSQQDVQELARMLTGWTINGLRADRGGAKAKNGYGFQFDAKLHEPGPKTLLGKRYSEAGAGEAEQAIRDLSRHRSTARFIATKLVRHFVADNPPAAAIERIAAAFQKSDGDLAVVSAELVELPEAWRAEARKFRTPQDWFVAMMRAFGIREVAIESLAALRRLRQPLWEPLSPKGFGDSLKDWSDPDSLMNRAELARSVARRSRGLGIEPDRLASTCDLPAGDPLRRFIGNEDLAADERLALVVAGPAFQWR